MHENPLPDRAVPDLRRAAEAEVAAAQRLHQPLARSLLRRFVVAYLGFALAIMGLQFAIDYRLARSQTIDSLNALADTFAPSVSGALWDYYDGLLQAITLGIGAHPKVVWVEVRGSDGNLSAQWQKPDGPAASTTLVVTRDIYHPLPGGQQKKLGTLRIASNDQLAVGHLLSGFVQVASFTALLLMLMLVILWLLVHRLVIRPLARFSQRVSVIESPESHPLFLDSDTRVLEIANLQNGFNKIMRVLAESYEHISAQNAVLEQRVLQRTSALEEANRQLAVLSNTDALTGLVNRRRFDAALTAEWSRARRGGEPLALIMLDIDHFKKYNDELGHLAGDECLKAVAHVLMKQARRTADVVARYGGEEFAFLLPNTEADAANKLAEVTRAAVQAAALVHPAASQGIVTISLGVAVMQVGSDFDAQALLHASDGALYRAKARGRNRVEFAIVTA